MRWFREQALTARKKEHVLDEGREHCCACQNDPPLSGEKILTVPRLKVQEGSEEIQPCKNLVNTILTL